MTQHREQKELNPVNRITYTCLNAYSVFDKLYRHVELKPVIFSDSNSKRQYDTVVSAVGHEAGVPQMRGYFPVSLYSIVLDRKTYQFFVPSQINVDTYLYNQKLSEQIFLEAVCSQTARFLCVHTSHCGYIRTNTSLSCHVIASRKVRRSIHICSYTLAVMLCMFYRFGYPSGCIQSTYIINKVHKSQNDHFRNTVC